MKTIKFIIFILSLFLINYVGGVPGDMKNLFITHTIFFTPYFLDLQQLLRIKFDLIVYWIIRIIQGLGCVIIVGNILGIFGIIKLNTETNNFQINTDYLLPISPAIGYDRYILIATVVYVCVFVATLLFSHMVVLQENANKAPDLKQETV